MMIRSIPLAILFAWIFVAGHLACPEPATAADGQRAFDDGNWAEAYDAFRAELLNGKLTGSNAADALSNATNCLARLNRIEESDEFVEAVVQKVDDDWRLVAAAANFYLRADNYGRMVDGKFHRGHGRGRSEVVNAHQRDLVRSLQLYLSAIDIARSTGAKRNAARLLLEMAAALRSRTGAGNVWRLQALTNLDELPDYELGWLHGGSALGAPVTPEGNPVLYAEPDSWDAAASDGERWRWLLAEAKRWNPRLAAEVLQRRAQFSQSQFGVQTIGHYARPFAADNGAQQHSSILSLTTLTDDETVARLATGIKRFELPAEHHHIRLLQSVMSVSEESGDMQRAASAAEQLAHIMLNRRQFPRGAEYFGAAIRYAGENKPLVERLQRQLDQVVEAWGQFEPVDTQPAGRGATIGFRYRNAKSVELVAKPIDIPRLLADVKAYLKAAPKRLDRNRTHISGIGYRILQKDEQKYVGDEVARWREDLDPPENHFDRRTTLSTPLQSPGAYLVTATVDGGNKSYIVVWVADTAIVRKPLAGKQLFYVADARTGQPISGATLEIFGYRQQRLDKKPREYLVTTDNFAQKTDDEGIALVEVPAPEPRSQRKWLAIATTEDGRLAFLGFDRFWTRQSPADALNQSTAFIMTDRPVYRPEQTVHFKAWIQRAAYGQATDESEFAHQAFRVEVYDAKNEKVLAQTITANAYGGIEGSYELPGGSPLGQYRVSIDGKGHATFRVEEYKKPEFEVEVVGPKETIALGGEFEATVRARYYFGSPVTGGVVKYKVTRSSRTAQWYPPSPWDWLYGPGYWWFGHESTWYPGWSRWGCGAPLPPWFGRGWQRPEVVAQGEASLDNNGEHKIRIDTALAKELHGNSDHSYRIEAEVVDGSRRTIVGVGEVLAARKPFEVFVWLDRGHYRVGDTITASVAARRPDGGPVAELGKLRLLKISYSVGDDGQLGDPDETEVRQWELPTGADGRVELQIKASEAGQYRLAFEVPGEADGVIEGAHLFTIAGADFDGGDFVFNDIELTPDRREYQPGDKVQLRVSTNQRDGAVLLFVRPDDGAYLSPQLVKLTGKSTVVEIDVDATDAPNFFVEATTVARAKVHTAVREIAVPPVKRVLNVEVLPSAEAYLPGQEATVRVRLTDETGEPFVGETVVTVYDKSVEYISGGSNVPGIREHFWSWRRRHSPSGQTSLDRSGSHLVAAGELQMQALGRFGHIIQQRGQTGRGLAPFGGGFGGGGGFADAVAAAPQATLGVEVREASEFAFAAVTPDVAPPTVRENFADTAFWTGSLETDESGLAEIKFTMPENLTAWKMRVWGMGHGARVGEGSAEVVTRKNLLVRLQTPRFLIERDEVVLSANVHNYLGSAKQVRVRLELDGDTLEAPSELEQTIEVPAGGDRRVDWRLKAVREGEAVVRALALTDEESDAMQLSLPVAVHGALRVEPFSGVIARDGRQATFEFTVPEQRRPEQTRLEVRYSPTLAGAMIDALPYLIDYPHGCTEQTLNRFLPAVLTQRTLRRMGIDLDELAEDRTDLDPSRGPEAQDAWRREQDHPIFDQQELDKIVATGLRRLTDMQLGDGGWGWFSGFGERSSAHTTAVVVRGLLIAQENDVAIVPSVIDDGLAWLKRHQQAELAKLKNAKPTGSAVDQDKPFKRYANNLDALVHLVLTEAGQPNAVMRDLLFRDRKQLSPYALAMLGIALHAEPEQAEKRDMVIRNLKQFLVTDDENQTAYLNLPSGSWWYWYGSEFEAHAYFLKLLVETEPEGDIAAGLVKYLLANRRHAGHWNSTRDTALVVEAMADYLKATGEGRPDLAVEVWLDGEQRKKVTITAENLLRFDNQFLVAGLSLDAGRHTLEIRKAGGGRLYWHAALTNFSLQDDIRATGLDLRVERRLYRLTPRATDDLVAGSQGQVVRQQGERFERTEVTNLASVESGDLIEVELTLHSKNDYEYLLLTDRKAAGFEPVDVRSGYTSNELGAYVEYRDAAVHLFLKRLARGSRSVSYRLRVETPGKFSAMPAEVAAMYAPELRGSSDEIKVRVRDRSAE